MRVGVRVLQHEKANVLRRVRKKVRMALQVAGVGGARPCKAVGPTLTDCGVYAIVFLLDEEEFEYGNGSDEKEDGPIRYDDS